MHDEPPSGDLPDESAETSAPSRRERLAAASAARRRQGRRGLAVKILTRTLAAFVALGVLGLIALFVIYQRTDIPTPNADAQKQISVIYYDDGKSEIARFNNTTREDVPIGKVPKHVQYAFLSAEDRSFYDNDGVSVTGMGRALWTNLTGGRMQGGSTITQQYVKNYFLSRDRTMSRKLREVMIAIKIDQQTPKDTILQNYLNTIYFGRNAYGIQAASKAYFNKDVSQLTVAEGAFLASAINSPSRMDPAGGPAALSRIDGRMQYVLDGMVTKSWLTQAQRDQQRMPSFAARKKVTVPGPTGYIRDLVEDELKGPLGLTQEDIDRGGLRITTSISKKAQDSAVNAVKNQVPNIPGTKDLHVGLVAQRPGDGAVVAVYGGKDPAQEANNATYQRIQAASGFKVFGLMGALDDGMTLRTQYLGNSPMRFREYRTPSNPRGNVTNFGHISWGNVTLRKATANSINTVYLQVNQDIGPQKTADVAVAAGIPKQYLGKPTLANILGTDSVRVMDMATAYNTIAGEGVRTTPYFIKKVTSVQGHYTHNAKPKKQRAIDRAVAMNTRVAMEDVVEYGSGADGTRGLGRPAAGKTGTANENRAVWFNGFTPQLTASVGIFKSKDGGKSYEEMTNIDGIPNVTGGTFPTEIWTAFMKGALAGERVEQFPAAPRLRETFSPTTKRTTDRPRPTTSSSSSTSSTTAPTETPSASSSSSSTPPTTSTAPPSTSTPPPSTPPPSTPAPTAPPTTTPRTTPTRPPAATSGSTRPQGADRVRPSVPAG